MAEYGLGVDIKILPDLDEDEILVSELDCLAQDILLRLSTARGALQDGTEEGAEYGLDVRAWLNESLTAQRLLELIINVELEVLKDDRVDSCSAKRSTYNQQTRELKLLLDIEVASGPHALSIYASATNLTLLEAN